MPERVTWRLYWATPLVGALGGWLASLVGWPLPWMIGSLLAVMLVRCLADLPLAEVPGGTQVRAMDRRHRHRPALHPGSDRASAGA